MMATSFLNTLFQNIYAFFIGNRAGMAPLGYYTQADKWSKMGISSLSQVLTSSFLPALSAVQDAPERFNHITRRINRFTSYLLFPAFFGLIVAATPIFHLLFGEKWDAAIPLFQLLLLRGIFTVLAGLWNNYILALGHARLIMWLEIIRDSVSLAALAVTLPYISLSTTANPTYGIAIVLWGQTAASAAVWAATLIATAKVTHQHAAGFLLDIAPYMTLSAVASAAMWACGLLVTPPAATLAAEILTGLSLYLLCNRLFGSKTQAEAIAILLHRKPTT